MFHFLNLFFLTNLLIFGTLVDFVHICGRIFFQCTNILGIKIILDYVPNHASTDSEYFKKSVAREPGYENYFVWADPVVTNTSNREVPSNWASIHPNQYNTSPIQQHKTKFTNKFQMNKSMLEWSYGLIVNA